MKRERNVNPCKHDGIECSRAAMWDKVSFLKVVVATLASFFPNPFLSSPGKSLTTFLTFLYNYLWTNDWALTSEMGAHMIYAPATLASWWHSHIILDFLSPHLLVWWREHNRNPWDMKQYEIWQRYKREGTWEPTSTLQSYASKKETFIMLIQWDIGIVHYISPTLTNTAGTTYTFLWNLQRFIFKKF